MKKKIFIILGLFIIVAAAVIYYLFSMKFKDMNDVQADYEISANDLIKSFQLNDSAANVKYSEKVIAVNGQVTDIETADTTINIKMTDEQSGSYLVFSFQKSEEALLKAVKLGDMISIKGSCSGAIFSEILSAYAISFKRCILINQKK